MRALREAGFAQRCSAKARRRAQGVGQEAREPARRFEPPAGRVRRKDGELRHDEKGVLEAVDQLLAECVPRHRALGGGVVPMEVDESADALVRAEPEVRGDEDDHGVVAVTDARKRRVGEPQRERHAERIARQRLQSGARSGRARLTLERAERESRERGEEMTAEQRTQDMARGGLSGQVSLVRVALGRAAVAQRRRSPLAMLVHT